MKIVWVNHASYLLEAGNVRLLCDPWLEGPAFNNGWHLLSPTKFSYEDFADVTHVWFSHEHPDHFSPQVIKRIPPEYRQAITVLYRKTRDRRVVNFCANTGFRVLELQPDTEYRLDQELQLRCGTVDSDSWLLAADSKTRVLNLNDCVLSSERDVLTVKNSCGDVDVLLTQFSFAGWCGNRDDDDAHVAEARRKLTEIARQVRVLKPRWVIPFASFVWFAHEENCHMNRHANRVEDVLQTIRDAGTEPVVLYPGDQWVVGESHDPRAAMERYDRDRAQLGLRMPTPSDPVSYSALEAAATEFCARIRRRNWLWTLKPLRWVGYLAPVRIYLVDHRRTVSFDMFSGFKDIGPGAVEPGLQMSAESLLFALRFDFGIDTLLINGRFQEAVPGARLMLSRQFAVARHNNDGFTFPGLLLNARFVASKLG